MKRGLSQSSSSCGSLFDARSILARLATAQGFRDSFWGWAETGTGPFEAHPINRGLVNRAGTSLNLDPRPAEIQEDPLKRKVICLGEFPRCLLVCLFACLLLGKSRRK